MTKTYLMDNEQLENLVSKLRGGDKSVSEQLILHFLGLAKSLARHSVARYPHKRDDIYAAAMFGVVQAVEWSSSRLYDNNLGPYITVTVRRFIKEYLERDHIIRIPTKEWRKLIKNLESEPSLKDVKQLTTVLQTSKNEVADFSWSNEPNILVFDNDPLVVEDIRKYLKLSYLENQIIQLRMEGYTFQEIGKSLLRSHSTIIKILKKLQERYRLIQRAHPSLPDPPKNV